MEQPVGSLPIGTRFTCPWNPGLKGELVGISPSCVTVVLNREGKTRTFTAHGADGQETTVALPGFRERTTWSADARVIPEPEGT